MERPPTRWRDAVALFGVSGLAIAQPLFDVLGRNTTFFAAHGFSGSRLVLYAVGTVLIPPLLLLVPVEVARLFRSSIARHVVALEIGALGSLAISSAVAKGIDLAWWAFAGGSITLAVLVALAYLRAELVRRYLLIVGGAPLVLVVTFLAFSPASTFLSAGTPSGDGRPADDASPISVVHVLLDEFSLGGILEPDGSIDAKRFPNLNELATRGTWYPNATSNANATRNAVPSVLTGRYPKPGELVAPIVSNFPDNEFTLLQRSHTVHTSEFVSRLCPPSACDEFGIRYDSVKHLAADSALIYLHAVAPEFVRNRIPPLPTQWGGFFADPFSITMNTAPVPQPLRRVARGLFHLLADGYQDPQSIEVRRFERLIEQIDARGRPSVWFHHAILPHKPWLLLPDGRPYDEQETPGIDRSQGAWVAQRDADEALQRYLLQVKAVDLLIGKLMKRLDDLGMWDTTMLIVHADHGVAFREGIPNRDITGQPEDLLPVPLFVKYPNQAKGRIDPANVELIDVLPTIVDVLGLDESFEMDGTSLRSKDRPRRSKQAWEWGDPLPPFGQQIDGATAVSRQIYKLFGPARETDDLFAWGPHADLVGDRAGRSTDDGGRGLIIEEPERFNDVDLEGPVLPARITATFEGPRSPWIAVEANGRIAGLGRPYERAGRQRLTICLSPRLLVEGRNTFRFFGIKERGQLAEISHHDDVGQPTG